jgi:leucyl-tRNA synthetase
MIYSHLAPNHVKKAVEKWPEDDPEALKEERFTLVVQVDGKVCAKKERVKFQDLLNFKLF